MLKTLAASALPLILMAACAVPREVEEAAQARRDYFLPYTAGTYHRCIQTGPGSYSHEGSQKYAVDFKMPVGTPVLAARGGRVAKVKEDSDRGGSSREYAAFANRVEVLHEDGSRAVYLHFRHEGAAVAVGERVATGQRIGDSGNTGWSTTPHLHFHVEERDPVTGRWSSVPIAFIDVSGSGVPRLLRSYTSGNRRSGPTSGGGAPLEGR